MTQAHPAPPQMLSLEEFQRRVLLYLEAIYGSRQYTKLERLFAENDLLATMAVTNEARRMLWNHH